MKFVEGALVETQDFWYDLFDGGGIKPKCLLADLDDILRVERAVRVLQEFKSELDNQGLIEWS